MNLIEKFKYNFINKPIDKVNLFFGFLIQKTEKDLTEWKLKDDKNLLTLFVEWIINMFFKYVIVGIMLSLALKNYNWFQCTIGYWLLIKVLWLIRNGE